MTVPPMGGIKTATRMAGESEKQEFTGFWPLVIWEGGVGGMERYVRRTAGKTWRTPGVL